MPVSALRALPSVEKLLGHEQLAAACRDLPRVVVVDAVRATLAEARERLRRAKRAGQESAPDDTTLAALAAARARLDALPALRRVLNATGIVLHTNLGRAPLASAAREAVAEIAAGYSSLEYDLTVGKRGDRGLGCEHWLTRLTSTLRPVASAANTSRMAAAPLFTTHAASAPVSRVSQCSQPSPRSPRLPTVRSYSSEL